MKTKLKEITRQDITVEMLADLFDCDFDNGGILIRKKSRMKKYVGEICDGMNDKGYKIVSIYGISFLQHIIVWALYNGEFPKFDIDHINRDKADNSITNLRKPPTSNAQNINSKPFSNNTSTVKGVSYIANTGKYEAKIKGNNGQRLHSFFSSSFYEAVMARWYMERREGWDKISDASTAYDFIVENDLRTTTLAGEDQFWINLNKNKRTYNRKKIGRRIKATSKESASPCWEVEACC